MPDILDLISKDLNVSRPFLENALNLAYCRYRKIRVKKRSGGERVMIQPAAELKSILAWLDFNVLEKLPLSGIATAFHKGASIVKNAKAHRESAFSVRVDITDFFPSIRSEDLITTIEYRKSLFSEWISDPSFKDLIKKACFDISNRLPIGYPTSPRIANAVMYEFDSSLEQIIKADPDTFGRAVLTRYADDFIFSTDRPGACRKFVSKFRTELAACSTPKLKMNDLKTRFMSRKGGSTLITGLRVNNESEVGVHPNYRDHVRLLLKLFSAGKLRIEDHQKLRGHLAFLKHADPGLFTRLAFKYHEEIEKLGK